jgi:hypothetical protein
MKSDLLPDHWKSFLEDNALVGMEIEFPWPGELDLKAMIQILDDETVEIESTEMWPGIGIKKDGFIPVAACSVGTGDQYCINTNDGPNGPLYLVDHERVGPDGYNRDEAVEIMLAHYRDLLNYIKEKKA